jgi:hypothetical protein
MNSDTSVAAEPDSIVISLRLDLELAAEFRMEAARRGMRLNKLFAEVWSLYRNAANVPSR